VTLPQPGHNEIDWSMSDACAWLVSVFDQADAPGVTASRGRFDQAVRSKVGGLPRPFWWLWLGTLINRAGTFINRFLMLYLTGPRHITVATAGTVLTVLGVGSMLSQPIGGVLTDRYGRRATLAASLTATAAMLLCLSMARSLSAIVAAVFVLGLSRTCIGPRRWPPWPTSWTRIVANRRTHCSSGR
jgi:predicted MFS family arabinose efflux permease